MKGINTKKNNLQLYYKSALQVNKGENRHEGAATGEQNLTSLQEWNTPACLIKGDVILHHRTSPPCDVTALSKA